MPTKDYIFFELTLECLSDTGLTALIIINSEILVLLSLKKNLTYNQELRVCYDWFQGGNYNSVKHAEGSL